MSDENTQDAVVTTDTAETVEAPQPKTKTFTEAEVNAMITTRIEKATRATEKRLADEAAETKRQAELTAEERARELEARNAQLEAEYQTKLTHAERKTQLIGKVSNADRVLKLMDSHDEYFEGTTPNVERILADFPEYAPQQQQQMNGQPLSNSKGTLVPRSMTSEQREEIAKRAARGEKITF